MFTICDLQLEPRRFHYITDLKFLSHASVATLYSINLEHNHKAYLEPSRILNPCCLEEDCS